MAKVLSLMLSVLLLLQSANPDMGDMLQISDLMEHARFHSEKYGDSFLTFLSKHYGALEQDHKKTHQEEQSQHEELPFNHQACNHPALVFVLTGKPLPSMRSVNLATSPSNFFYQDSSSSFEQFEIFQPPRLT